MSCTFAFKIFLGLLFTSYACSSMHAAGRTDPRQIAALAALGLSYPGWLLALHIVIVIALKGTTPGFDFQTRGGELVEPLPVALTALMAGLITAGVTYWTLRDARLARRLCFAAGLAGGLCLLEAPGVLVAMLLWHTIAMWSFARWSKAERARQRDARRCGWCGYSLAGLMTTRCPECGGRVYASGARLEEEGEAASAAAEPSPGAGS
ncbi:MAG: hypothetical protein VYC34_01520 [Planctomycetota bacterium]|nr:hypothetical protein [Planctomycetota bacterium]